MATLRDLLAKADPDALWRDETGQLWDLYDLKEHWQEDLDSECTYEGGLIYRLRSNGSAKPKESVFLEIPRTCSDPQRHPYSCECESF